VTQRTRFTVYLITVHVLLAASGVVHLLKNPVWLFIVEAVFVISATIGITLTRRMFSTVGQAAVGSQLIRDGEFTSRLLPVGQPEVDELIGVFNRMVDHLSAQRTHLQEQQHFLADVLRVSPAGILVLDFDRRIVSINPAGERLLGRTLDQVTGVGLDDVEAAAGTLGRRARRRRDHSRHHEFVPADPLSPRHIH
jgi:nitrogen fixation/metabolism regulation signal transduction histidine kinase